MRTSIFPPEWTTPTPGTQAASVQLDLAVTTLDTAPVTREAAITARSHASTAVELLQKEPETVVPAHFAAGQAQLGIELLDEALKAAGEPAPSLVEEARGRLEQALRALPG